MAEEESSGNLLGPLIEGGALRALLGPEIAKVFGRLLGAAVSIPEAASDWAAQRIRDDSAARTLVSDALAKKVAELASADEAVVERAARRLLGKATRQQLNLEAVAREAVEQLAVEPPPVGSKGPSEDFLNFFEARAADASSAELRALFARILAGECRKPGAFSLATLQVLSIMDTALAEKVELVRPWVSDEHFVLLTAPFTGGNQLAAISRLADHGILRMGLLNRPIPFDETGRGAVRYGERAIVLEGPPGTEHPLPIAQVTPVGEQVFSLVEPRLSQIDFDYIVAGYKSLEGLKVSVGKARVNGRDLIVEDIEAA